MGHMLKHRVDLYLEHRSLRLNQVYSYLAPNTCTRGMRVKVPFGNQIVLGFVIQSYPYHEEELSYELKDVLEVLDDEAVLNEELIQLGEWMSHHFMSSTISCFQAMLPKAKNIRSSHVSIKKERILHKRDVHIELSPKQRHVYESVLDNENYTLAKKKYKTVLDTLIQKGCLELEVVEASYQVKPIETRNHAPKLSDEQLSALNQIRSSDKPVCLFGTTGSGKTEIYLALAEEAIQAKKQALLLVPEIGLTPQMIQRVQDRFGQDVVVYHSHLNPTERYLQYKRILNQEALLVVGTRSAIFLPFVDLALIVIDEEHDGSYKQDSQPRYHVLDVALERAKKHQSRVVLGSATPSFETFARASKGVYHLVRLNKRVQGILPTLKAVVPNRLNKEPLSQESLKAIEDRLAKKEQVIILLNRRGYAPIVECMSCHHTMDCPQCDRLLHYHKEDHKLKCHECGFERPMVESCPKCSSQYIRTLGLGTQRLVEVLSAHFNEARILRMDRDTTSVKNGHEKILSQFERHEADILVGTQMIAKGLDMPMVSLSIILGIDQSLLGMDYRSIEDGFDLLVQTAGRAGRKDIEGEVIVETRLKDHYAIQAALSHDYESFFVKEMQYRHLSQNPPYQYLVTLSISASKPTEGSDVLRHIIPSFDPSITVLGPSDLGKVMNRYRSRLILKAKDLELIRDELNRLMPNLSLKYDMELSVDVNPRSLF